MPQFFYIFSRREHVQENKEPKIRIDEKELVEISKHEIRIKGNRYHCMDCLSSFKAGDPASKYWLQASCPGKAVDAVHKPTKINDIVHKGNQSSHVSHELYNCDGLVYCKNCGAYGIEHFVNIANACEGPTAAGNSLQKYIIRRVWGTTHR